MAKRVYCVLLWFTVFQMEEIVQKFGMVVISRAGSNLEKFIYESDILTKHKVYCVFNLYINCKTYDAGDTGEENSGILS